MSQHDFGNLESPLSGSALINTHLEPWRDALHSLHKGNARPTYAVAGMVWINDTSSSLWVLNVFDGAQDIALGAINTVTNIFVASSVDKANVTGISAFIQTLLDDADAATAKTTLGISWATLKQTATTAASGVVTKATTGQLVTETADVYSDVATLKYYRGVCKAWVKINAAASASITNSYGLSSLTDNGVGDWSLNFAANMANANFCALATASGNASLANVIAQSVGSMRIGTANSTSGVAADVGVAYAAAFGEY